MKYRFEKMERDLTPEERKVRTRIAFSILFAILIVLIILFGQRWYKVQVFHKRVAELKTLVEAGRLLDACEMIRVRDRESASAAARWAQVTGNDRIVTEMKLINSTHSPDWSVWETVIRFSLDVESGYDKVFIYMKWTQEDGKWVFGLMDAREYRPTDGELGMKLGDMLDSFTGLNLEDYLKEEPPGVPE